MQIRSRDLNVTWHRSRAPVIDASASHPYISHRSHQPPKSNEIFETLSDMAANARYERAPTRDSFEDQQYTQAPPSYQATSVPDPAPRSEDDNLPDDFKVGPIVSD